VTHLQVTAMHFNRSLNAVTCTSERHSSYTSLNILLTGYSSTVLYFISCRGYVVSNKMCVCGMGYDFV